jgi:hypothetical protein
LQREISNVAKVCGLPTFRYVAFAPLMLPEKPRSDLAATPVTGTQDRSVASLPVVPAPIADPLVEPAFVEPAIVTPTIVTPMPVTPAVVMPTLVTQMPEPPPPEPTPPAIHAAPNIARPDEFTLLSDVVVALSPRRSPATAMPQPVRARPVLPQPAWPQPAAAPREATAPTFALLDEVASAIRAARDAPTSDALPPITGRVKAPRKRAGRTI